MMYQYNEVTPKNFQTLILLSQKVGQIDLNLLPGTKEILIPFFKNLIKY